MLGIFLDQETSGLDSSRHRVLEIGIVISDLATGERKGAYEAVLAQPAAVWAARDPNSIVVNGFSWETMASQGHPKEVVAEEIIALLQSAGIVRGKSVFICQNPSFDRPFFAQLIDPYKQEQLVWPYHWLDLASMYWALAIKERRLLDETALSKDTIAKTLQLPPEARPHRAMRGVEHLMLCYERIVGYPEAPC